MNITDSDTIGRLISAISNGARLHDKSQGYILWGVEDSTHAIGGTSFRPGSDKIKGHPYQLWMAQQISPSLHLQFHEADCLIDKRIVLLEIPAAEKVTTKFQGQAYIRVGEATPPLSRFPGIEAALVNKLNAFNWESGIAAAFISGPDVLRLLNFRSYFVRLQKPLPTSESGILDALSKERLIEQDVGSRWNILNLGAILFAENLNDFDKIKRKAIRLVKYNGRSKASPATELPISRSYIDGYDLMLEHLNAVLPQNEEIVRAFRVQKPIYPDIAIRELVANALIHQDMTVTGSGPMIDVFDDRLEISNPGAPLVDPNRFLDSTPRSRNENLASMLRRIGMCEERGSGVRKVITAIEVWQLPAPEFTGYNDSVRVTLFAPMKFSELDEAGRVRACYQHAVLQHVTHQKMTNASLRQRLGIGKNNAAQVTKVINQAIAAGQIRKSEPWSPRQGHYLPWWVLPS